MNNALMTPDDRRDISNRIFYKRVKTLNAHLLVTTIPALILCATIVFLGLFELENKTLVFRWYLATLALCATRYFFMKWYERDSRHLARHLGIFILGSTLSGLLWGFAGTMLTPPHNILHKVFIIIIIAGLDAGGCQTLKASRAANSLFILTSILPFAVWTLFQKQPIYTYLSISVFGYLGFMIFLAHKSYLQFINSLQLFYENELLVEKLKKTNAILNREILAHEDAKNKLKYLASHDYLTGIDNRLSFDAQFQEILTLSKVQRDEFCVMYVDIDYFKAINDNYGHDFGDDVLIAVANGLMQHLRPQDMLARLGGDEFVILLREPNIEPYAEKFCRQVFQSFEQPQAINGHSLLLSLSVGGSFYPQDGDSRNILLKKADIALYQAKVMGRGRYAFYKEERKVFE